MAWEGEALKTVVFTPTDSLQAHEVFKLVSGADPDTFQKLRGPLPGMSVAAGQWDGLQLSVSVQPGRIEAGLSEPDAAPDAAVLASNMANLDKPLRLIRAAAQTLGKYPVTRVAAHLQLVREISSPDVAATELNKELGSKIFPDKTYDLQYQINVVKDDFASMQGLRLNRLCRWGVAVQSAMLFGIDPAGTAIAQSPGIQRPVIFMHLDFNNAPLKAPLGAVDVAKLIDAVWDEAIKVKDNGCGSLS